MIGWQPFVMLNAALILSLGGVLWIKFHKLRLDMEEQFRVLREAPPPIFIGEAFLGERFERLEKQMTEVRARLDEIEQLIMNGQKPPAAGGSG